MSDKQSFDFELLKLEAEKWLTLCLNTPASEMNEINLQTEMDRCNKIIGLMLDRRNECAKALGLIDEPRKELPRHAHNQDPFIEVINSEGEVK